MNTPSRQGDGDPGLPVCEWREDGNPSFNTWTIGCRDEEWGDDLNPSELGYKFCPFCGKELREVPYTEEAS